MEISLNMFTNCSIVAPDTKIIENTYNSFCDTFGKLKPTVYLDPHPYTYHKNNYIKNLYKIFDEIIIADSLSDAYMMSVENSESDYCFQLEHDWAFNDNINHTLGQIVSAMQKDNLYHLRFNKRENIICMWDKWLIEKKSCNVDYCLTPNMSNNPHIIDRLQYMSIYELIENKAGSKGIEEILLKRDDLVGAIYGNKNYPATVTHLDGRHE